MKKILVLCIAFISVLSVQGQQASDSIEGRWVIEGFSNTMYEFEDGLRYTYYCTVSTCDSNYWNSLTQADALPNPDPYVFNNDTLTIDLSFGNYFIEEVSFSCDGKVINFTGAQSSWYRVGTDLAGCNFATIENSSTLDYPKKIAKILDILGRETKVEPGKIIIYVYTDGSIEKKYFVQ